MTAQRTTTRRKAPAFKPTAYPDIYEATMADAKRAGLFGDPTGAIALVAVNARAAKAREDAAGGDGGGEAAAPPAGQDAGDAA